MQVGLSELFITMPEQYGELEKGKNYTLQQILDHIDDLGDRIEELENERDRLRGDLDEMREQIELYYRPASPYEITGLRESDFH